MRSDNRKRKTGRRITRKRTNRTRMTNKKRTSKRLYKRSLRKNKYKSRKSRSHMKGGRPRVVETGSSDRRSFGDMINQSQIRRRAQELERDKRKVTGQKRKKSPNATKRKRAKLYFKRNKGSLAKKALGVGLSAAAGVGTVLAAPTLATLGIGAAAAAGTAAAGYGIKKAIDDTGLKDYSFDLIDENISKIIFQFTDKNYNINNFFLISRKDSKCIDRLIYSMNTSHSLTVADGGGSDGGSEEGSDAEDSTNASSFPLNLINDKKDDLDITILQYENDIKRYRLLNRDITEKEKLLNQKYNEKLHSFLLEVDEAFLDTKIDSFKLYENFRNALLALVNLDKEYIEQGKQDLICNIKLNQWVLGYTEDKENIRIVLTDLTIDSRQYNPIEVVLVKDKKEQAADELKQSIKRLTEGKVEIKKKNLKDICEYLVHQVNIDNLDSSVLVDGLTAVNDLNTPYTFTTEQGTQFRAAMPAPEEAGSPPTPTAVSTPVSTPVPPPTPTAGPPAGPPPTPTAVSTAEAGPPLPFPTAAPGEVASPGAVALSGEVAELDKLDNIDYTHPVSCSIRIIKIRNIMYIKCELNQATGVTGQSLSINLPGFRVSQLQSWVSVNMSNPDKDYILELIKPTKFKKATKKITAIGSVFTYLMEKSELNFLKDFFVEALDTWISPTERERYTEVEKQEITLRS